MTATPRISIVTPCLNAAAFLGQAIDSVLGQSGVEVEYFVMDGGSTDGSREIIESYSDRLAHWCSEPDGGQAAAINRALERATGDVFGWLNADDLLLPRAALGAAQAILRGADLVSGGCLLFDEAAGWAQVRRAPSVLDPTSLAISDPLDQPSTFWSRALWRRTGPLDESLHYVMDWDWFNRALATGLRYASLGQALSAYRVHAGHKTGRGGAARRAELRAIATRYAPAPWPAAFAAIDERFLSRLSRLEKGLARRALWRLQPLVRRASVAALNPGAVRRCGMGRLLRATKTLGF